MSCTVKLGKPYPQYTTKAVQARCQVDSRAHPGGAGSSEPLRRTEPKGKHLYPLKMSGLSVDDLREAQQTGGEMNLNDIIIDYDPAGRVFHLTARHKIRISTTPELHALCHRVQEAFQEHAEGGRSYLIVDMSRIAIDDHLANEYARHVQLLLSLWIHPNGIARYGFEITRITAMEGHRHMTDEKDPHLFATRDEAYAYILGLIRRRTTLQY